MPDKVAGSGQNNCDREQTCKHQCNIIARGYCFISSLQRELNMKRILVIVEKFAAFGALCTFIL